MGDKVWKNRIVNLKSQTKLSVDLLKTNFFSKNLTRNFASFNMLQQHFQELFRNRDLLREQGKMKMMSLQQICLQNLTHLFHASHFAFSQDFFI